MTVPPNACRRKRSEGDDGARRAGAPGPQHSACVEGNDDEEDGEAKDNATRIRCTKFRQITTINEKTEQAMRPSADHARKVLRLASRAGWVRARDLDDEAIPRVVLTRMVASGQLERAARGLYRVPGAPASEHEGLLTVAQKAPQAVICLLSALQFHGLTTQLPWQVWIAMPRGSHTPRIGHPPLRMVQFTGEAYNHGIEAHEIAGGTLRVYSVAKTVADCFKHRNKVGLDVALEALKDARAQGKATFDDLWRSAKVCRVSNLMRPYMEAVA